MARHRRSLSPSGRSASWPTGCPTGQGRVELDQEKVRSAFAMAFTRLKPGVPPLTGGPRHSLPSPYRDVPPRRLAHLALSYPPSPAPQLTAVPALASSPPTRTAAQPTSGTSSTLSRATTAGITSLDAPAQLRPHSGLGCPEQPEKTEPLPPGLEAAVGATGDT